MKSARSKLYCIMFSGASLSDAACDALFQAACDCVRDEKHEKKVYHDDVIGVVHTDFDFGMTGCIGGIVFEGEIETSDGDTKVKYLVQRHDLENARKHMEWTRMSFDEFVERMKEKRDSHKWN